MSSDSESGGPVQYSDDQDSNYDQQNPDRSSVVSTGPRQSRPNRQSKINYGKRNSKAVQTGNANGLKNDTVDNQFNPSAISPENVVEQFNKEIISNIQQSKQNIEVVANEQVGDKYNKTISDIIEKQEKPNESIQNQNKQQIQVKGDNIPIQSDILQQNNKQQIEQHNAQNQQQGQVIFSTHIQPQLIKNQQKPEYEGETKTHQSQPVKETQEVQEVQAREAEEVIQSEQQAKQQKENQTEGHKLENEQNIQVDEQKVMQVTIQKQVQNYNQIERQQQQIKVQQSVQNQQYNQEQVKQQVQTPIQNQVAQNKSDHQHIQEQYVNVEQPEINRESQMQKPEQTTPIQQVPLTDQINKSQQLQSLTLTQQVTWQPESTLQQGTNQPEQLGQVPRQQTMQPQGDIVRQNGERQLENSGEIGQNLHNLKQQFSNMEDNQIEKIEKEQEREDHQQRIHQIAMHKQLDLKEQLNASQLQIVKVEPIQNPLHQQATEVKDANNERADNNEKQLIVDQQNQAHIQAQLKTCNNQRQTGNLGQQLDNNAQQQERQTWVTVETGASANAQQQPIPSPQPYPPEQVEQKEIEKPKQDQQQKQIAQSNMEQTNYQAQQQQIIQTQILNEHTNQQVENKQQQNIKQQEQGYVGNKVQQGIVQQSRVEQIAVNNDIQSNFSVELSTQQQNYQQQHNQQIVNNQIQQQQIHQNLHVQSHTQQQPNSSDSPTQQIAHPQQPIIANLAQHIGQAQMNEQGSLPVNVWTKLQSEQLIRQSNQEPNNNVLPQATVAHQRQQRHAHQQKYQNDLFKANQLENNPHLLQIKEKQYHMQHHLQQQTQQTQNKTQNNQIVAQEQQVDQHREIVDQNCQLNHNCQHQVKVQQNKSEQLTNANQQTQSPSKLNQNLDQLKLKQMYYNNAMMNKRQSGCIYEKVQQDQWSQQVNNTKVGQNVVELQKIQQQSVYNITSLSALAIQRKTDIPKQQQSQRKQQELNYSKKISASSIPFSTSLDRSQSQNDSMKVQASQNLNLGLSNSKVLQKHDSKIESNDNEPISKPTIQAYTKPKSKIHMDNFTNQQAKPNQQSHQPTNQNKQEESGQLNQPPELVLKESDNIQQIKQEDFDTSRAMERKMLSASIKQVPAKQQKAGPGSKTCDCSIM